MKKTKIDLIKLDTDKEQPKPSQSEEGKASAQGSDKGKITISLSKKKILILGVAVILLLGGGVGAASYLGYLPFSGASREKSKEAPKSDKLEVGETIKLTPLVVNLREEDGRSYLKMTMVLEVEKKEAEEIKARIPALTDAAICILSDKKMEDLKPPESKDRLKLELLGTMNQSLAPQRVRQIYFDEFIYQ